MTEETLRIVDKVNIHLGDDIGQTICCKLLGCLRQIKTISCYAPQTAEIQSGVMTVSMSRLTICLRDIEQVCPLTVTIIFPVF